MKHQEKKHMDMGTWKSICLILYINGFQEFITFLQNSTKYVINKLPFLHKRSETTN